MSVVITEGKGTFFVHAGGSKAGSSALQNFFEANASRLEKLNFAYENRLNIKSEYEITGGNGMLLYTLLSSETNTDSEIDSLLLSYFGRCSNAICSSEFFSLFDAYIWKKLYESSVRLGVGLKVIFYVRNVIPFFLSVYDQHIKRSGEWRSFDEWVAITTWNHAGTLRIIADELPQSTLQVLHFDQVKTRLIRSFLDILGVDPLFSVGQNDYKRRVNRSLTNEERGILIAVNKAFGQTYSKELSDLLIYANPNESVEPISYNQTTTELLLDRFNNDVNWVNNTFFSGKSIVSVLPTYPIKKIWGKKLIFKSVHHSNVDKLAMDWAIEKMKTIKEETSTSILTALNKAASFNFGESNKDIPADFDALAYLILNSDILLAGEEPLQHFLCYGKQEGRKYRFSERNRRFTNGFDALQLAKTEYGFMLVFTEDKVIGQSLLSTGAFQESKISEVVGFLERMYQFKPHTFIDIGANIGTHLIYALKSGVFKDAVGIEADQRNFSLLLCNTILNGLMDNTRLLNMALSDQSGIAELELSPTNFGDHRIRREQVEQRLSFGENERSIRDVLTQTFDDIFRESEISWQKSLVWIDTQGHEGFIFAGCRHLFAQEEKPFVVTEFWPYGLECSGGKSLYFEFLSQCKKIYDINSANWHEDIGISIDTLYETYLTMLAQTTENHHPHTDLLCIL